MAPVYKKRKRISLYQTQKRGVTVIIASKTGSIADIDVRTAKNTMQVFEGSLALV
ncbi:hypothetical protein Bca4012_088368 [Brassica carinata]